MKKYLLLTIIVIVSIPFVVNAQRMKGKRLLQYTKQSFVYNFVKSNNIFDELKFEQKQETNRSRLNKSCIFSNLKIFLFNFINKKNYTASDLYFKSSSSYNNLKAAYTVTFYVTDGTNAIEDATVSLSGYGDQITDANGEAIFTNVMPDNNINYTVTATGYNTVTNSIDVVNSNVSENVTMNLITYSVTFYVSDGTNVLDGATVSLSGYGDKTTDVNGEAIFSNVIPENDIDYTVAANGYNAVTGLVTVINDDVVENVTLDLVTYSVTFQVSDGESPIDGATVSLSGYGNKTTDFNGEVIFNDVVPDNGIVYTVAAAGYKTITNSIDVVSSDVTENVIMNVETYNITFYVTDGTNAIEGANVSLSGYGNKTTDVNGQVVFNDVVPANDIYYTITANGYETFTNSIDVVNSDVTENVILTAVSPIDEDVSIDVKIYPNPTKGYIILESNIKQNSRIDIFNLSGQIVKSEKIFSEKQRIDLTELAKGMYFIKLKNKRDLKIGKIIIK